VAFFLGDQFNDSVAAGDKRVDQPGFRLLPEGMFLDEADRFAVLRRGGPD
jgi:hypothetical protein